MATQTEELHKSEIVSPQPISVIEVETQKSTLHRKAVAGLLAELDENRLTGLDKDQGGFKRLVRAVVTAPEILILVVWIAMVYALWSQFRGPILALLK